MDGRFSAVESGMSVGATPWQTCFDRVARRAERSGGAGDLQGAPRSAPWMPVRHEDSAVTALKEMAVNTQWVSRIGRIS